jgi:isopentenyl phosphate kinase
MDNRQSSMNNWHWSMENELILLKLGGSLLTDKARDKATRPEVIARLAGEIAAAGARATGLILGHGSGSFGHTTAKRHGTRGGARTPEEWRGFAEVSVAAQQLNRIVADALAEAGAPVFSVAPSASAHCDDGVLTHMELAPLAAALEHGLTPLVMGDVAFDRVRGGTIVSTEEVFAYIAGRLPVARVLLAGETEGVYASMDDRRVIDEITHASWERISAGVGASRGADVTGGMAGKVRDMLALTHVHPGLTVRIFSGLIDGAVARALAGEAVGTLVRG